MSEVIKSYKGFNKDMTCKDYQFEEGQEYETERAEACEEGFHTCEYPLDVFEYYNPAESVFHQVEQSGEISRKGNDNKVASTKIKIGASINIAGLVKAAIEYTTSRITQGKTSNDDYSASSNTGDCGASSNTGYRGASSNTGYCGASSNTGNCGASSNTGYRGASSNTGDYGASSNTGNYGASSNTGYYSASSNTGDCGASSNTGYYGASSNTGYRGASSNTGDYGASSNTGNCGTSSNTGYCGSTEAGHPNSVAIAWGPESKAKGVLGSFLVFAEWEDTQNGGIWEERRWDFKGAKMVRVDGEKIKADRYYKLKNGELVESE